MSKIIPIKPLKGNLVKPSKVQAAPRVKGIRAVAGENNTAKESSVKLRCGDCLHFKGVAHPSMGQSCVNLGVGKGAVAPSCFMPNVGVFRDEAAATLSNLFLCVAGFSAQKQRILMGLLRNAATLSRTGFNFCETVYFSTCLTQKATLSDFYRGFVLGRGPGQTLQVVGLSFLNGKNAPCIAFLEKDSLLTRAKFDKERHRLIGLGSLEALPPRVIRAMSRDDYEPPTLDTAKEFLERNAISSKKFKSQVRGDQQRAWTIDQEHAEKDVAETDGL